MYVASLPSSYTSEQMCTLFAPFGEIVSAKTITDYSTQQCKGYGFVLFKKPESALDAVRALNGTRVNDNRIQVRLARPAAPGDAKEKGAAVHPAAPPVPPPVTVTIGEPRNSTPTIVPQTPLGAQPGATTPAAAVVPLVQQQPPILAQVPMPSMGALPLTPNHSHGFLMHSHVMQPQHHQMYVVQSHAPVPTIASAAIFPAPMAQHTFHTAMGPHHYYSTAAPVATQPVQSAVYAAAQPPPPPPPPPPPYGFHAQHSPAVTHQAPGYSPMFVVIPSPNQAPPGPY